MASFVRLDPAPIEAQLLDFLVTEANTFTFSVSPLEMGIQLSN